MSVGYLDQVPAQDQYVDALRLGPDFETVHALITVEDNDAFMQFAQGGTGDWMWHTEREWRAIPQGMVIGNVIGVQFRNATPGKIATITADLLTPSDPDFQVGTPFASGGTVVGTVVRGYVNGDGSINTGTGFTVAHTGTGGYTVTFTTPFGATPAIVATRVASDSTAQMVEIGSIGRNSFTVTAFTLAGTPRDAAFAFIAYEPGQ